MDAKLKQAVQIHQQGRLDEACAIYQDLAAAAPYQADPWYYLGIVELQKSRPDLAEPLFARALSRDPNHAKAHNNLGSAYIMLKRPIDAEKSFENALKIAPNEADYWHNLLITLSILGRKTDARQKVVRALEHCPSSAVLLNDQALMLKEDRQYEAAAIAFRNACQAAPNDTTYLQNLAFCLEHINQIEEAEQICLQLISKGLKSTFLNLLYGKILSRKGEHVSALPELKLASQVSDTPTRQSAFFIMGKSLHLLGRYQEAFVAFEHGNQLAIQSTNGKCKEMTHRYRVRLRAISETFSAQIITDQIANLRVDKTKFPSPVLLTGFFQSGTTRAGEILERHPDVTVLKDDSPIWAVIDQIHALTGAPYPQGCLLLKEDQLDILREIFWSYAELASGNNRFDKVLIDNSPLGIADLGIYSMLFPDSSILFAIRDPRDVCLECFMRDYVLTPALANFTSLDKAAALYQDIINFWNQIKPALASRVIEFQYDELFDEVPSLAQRLIKACKLDWPQNILIAPNQAEKEYPNWRHYEDKLKAVDNILAPFAIQFGYKAR